MRRIIWKQAYVTAIRRRLVYDSLMYCSPIYKFWQHRMSMPCLSFTLRDLPRWSFFLQTPPLIMKKAARHITCSEEHTVYPWDQLRNRVVHVCLEYLHPYLPHVVVQRTQQQLSIVQQQRHLLNNIPCVSIIGCYHTPRISTGPWA